MRKILKIHANFRQAGSVNDSAGCGEDYDVYYVGKRDVVSIEEIPAKGLLTHAVTMSDGSFLHVGNVFYVEFAAHDDCGELKSEAQASKIHSQCSNIELVDRFDKGDSTCANQIMVRFAKQFAPWERLNRNIDHEFGPGTILVTRGDFNSNVVGNAIVLGQQGLSWILATDYGNLIRLNIEEIEELFVIRFWNFTKDVDGFSCDEMQKMTLATHKYRRLVRHGSMEWPIPVDEIAMKLPLYNAAIENLVYPILSEEFVKLCDEFNDAIRTYVVLGEGKEDHVLTAKRAIKNMAETIRAKINLNTRPEGKC